VSLWKDRFITLGKFDPGLDSNGAENLGKFLKKIKVKS